MIQAARFGGSLVAVFMVFQTSALADETLFDAANVVVDDLHRFEYLADFEGDGGHDILDWFWIGASTIRVTGWNVTSSVELEELWSFTFTDADVGGSASAVGDFDQDGLDDFVIATGSDVRVFKSVADSTPVLWASWSENSDVRGVQIEDFDQDGDHDIALIRSLELRIYTTPNNGTAPIFSDSAVIGSAANYLRICEANGDATPDLVLMEGPTLRVVEVSGGVVIGSTTYTTSLAGERFPVAGDIDGDSDWDIVVFSDTENYRVYRRVDATTFIAESPKPGGPATDFDDIDGDGDLDGLCCGGGGDPDPHNWLESIFRVSLNDGTGNFEIAFEIQGLGAHHLAGAADLDGDGDKDLVAGRCIYLSPGGVTRAPADAVSGILQTHRSMIDFDGDFDLDIDCTLSSVSKNLGNGTFQNSVPVIPEAPAGTVFEGPGFPGDFDGDGDTDLIVSHLQGTTFISMRLLLNNGGGGFEDGGPAGAPGDDFNANPHFERNNPEWSLAADVDGDHDIDLISRRLGYGSEWTYLRYNTGNGYFDPNELSFTGEIFHDVADMNGDDRPDIILTSYGAPAIRYGQEGGGFSNPVTLPGLGDLSTESRFTVFDADGDGDYDVSSIKWQDGTLRLLTNDGTGSFSAQTLYDRMEENSTYYRTLSGDVNGDGRKDIVGYPVEWANHTYNSDAIASVVLIKKAWEPGYEDPVVQIITPSILADVDGDGDDDVVGTKLVLNRHHEGPQAGVRRQYGDGFPGTGGMVPTLGADGPFRVGETASLRLTGAAGQVSALMAIGLSASDVPDCPKPGMHCYVTPWLFFMVLPTGGQAGAAGEGWFEFSYQVIPDLAGVDVFHQVFGFDPGSSTNLSSSNGLEIQYR